MLPSLPFCKQDVCTTVGHAASLPNSKQDRIRLNDIRLTACATFGGIILGKIAYFDCFSGISGDMTLGALVDAGLDQDELKNELAKLNLGDEYTLSFTKSEKHGITGTKANVTLSHNDEHSHEDPPHENHHHHEHRKLTEILELIDSSGLSQRVKETAKNVFDRLAQAEARIHNTTKDDVYLHEVSAVDSIVDIVGSAIGIKLLGIEEIFSSPLSLGGGGFVKCAHGILPVPVPATLELLKNIPVRQTSIKKELVTPTGAAIISTLAKGFGSMPEMTIEQIGYGAGGRDLAEQPNMLRIVIGEKKNTAGADLNSSDEITVLETNIDDMSPETYGYVMEKLFQEGALDVFFTPIFMKKNRPAIKLTVLTHSQNKEKICNCIISETTTFGVRFYETERKKLSREFVTVDTQYGEVRMKLGKLDDEVIKAMCEYEDCKRLAEENGVTIKSVYQAAEESYRN